MKYAITVINITDESDTSPCTSVGTFIHDEDGLGHLEGWLNIQLKNNSHFRSNVLESCHLNRERFLDFDDVELQFEEVEDSENELSLDIYGVTYYFKSFLTEIVNYFPR